MVVIKMFNLLLGVALTLIIQRIPRDVKEIKEDQRYQKKLPEPYQVADAWHNTLGDK